MRWLMFVAVAPMLACGRGPGVSTRSDVGNTTFDVIIDNGRVVDGTGNPWFRADVGLRDGRIVAIGRLKDASARARLDAADHVIAPGFIDLMGATDWTLLADSRAASHVTQGITLLVSGEGGSVAPASDRTIAESKAFFDRLHVQPTWRTLDDFFRRLQASPPTVNFATFVGAGEVRDLVIGRENRRATPAELAEMERLVAGAMDDGAFGLSTALMYVPDRFADTDEIIALAKVAARYGGIYATHQRSEADGIDQSLDEIFRIGREAGLPLHIFHLKTMYRQNFGKMPGVLERLETARRNGIDLTADAYPYVAASASLDALVPPWAREGGADAMVARLRDPSTRERVRRDLSVSTPEWENEYYGAGGASGFIITDVINPALKPLVGKRLSAIAAERHGDPIDVLMDLIIEDRGRSAFVSFIMDERDVRLALAADWVAFCTDSPDAAPDGPLAESLPHPRAYGAFPRVFGKYVREEHAMTLEAAVRKASALPAQLLGIRDRGLVREGFLADLVIFDPATIADRATFEAPHQYSTGIDYVLVNGAVVVDHGRITEARPGRVVRGPGFRLSAHERSHP
jgi:N-acyl-D-amino-acid deacylase